MSENHAGIFPFFPKPRETIYVRESLCLLEVYTRYRGKTNGYFIDRTSILSILDKFGQVIEGRWEHDWIEVVPGIETRCGNLVQRQSIADRNHESAMTACVRIHRHACPVRIEFRNTMEYTDYDDYRYSTSESVEYWICYVA